jgi:general secretion pathway protein G
MIIQKRQSRGFTLIEVMVVVVILGILAAFIVPKIIGRPDEAKVAKVKSDVSALQTALDLYRLDNGAYPTADQGLQALIKKPTAEPIPNGWRTGGYIQKLNDDPWGRPYLYLNPGEHLEVDIFSYGAAGKQVVKE